MSGNVDSLLGTRGGGSGANSMNLLPSLAMSSSAAANPNVATMQQMMLHAKSNNNNDGDTNVLQSPHNFQGQGRGTDRYT